MREVLGAVGLDGWCKTSGSKGLQLYVPLNTPCTHEHAADFALAVGQVLETPAPRPGDDDDGQGGAAREDLRRLEPERPAQDDDRRVLDARPPGADGVDAGDVGRGRRRAPPATSSCASSGPTCSPDSTTLGDLFAPVLTVEQTLPGT